MNTENGADIFEKVADIIAQTSDIPRDTIKPESHAITDLGIDSLRDQATAGAVNPGGQ